MNDTIQKIREFIRSNSDGDPQKFISFFSFLLFGDGGSNTLNEDIRILKSKAENGDPETPYCLGFCYENGIGVPEDKAEAVNWCRKAAEQGYAPAQGRLGIYYECGDGVPEDNAEAANWFRKAADQGDADAQWRLGECYANGAGVPEDNAEAANWYRKAADQGHCLALWQLGECYANGTGVPEDKAEAVKCYRKAVRQGYEPFFFVIDSLGELGREVKEEIAKMYRRKADQGEADAQWQLGDCYANGEGVPEDKAEAAKWYRKAADQGHYLAQWQLGECYANGTGVPADKSEAVKWLCRAVRQGYVPYIDSDLIDSLGELANQVEEEVVNLYRREADQGSDDAQWRLGECYAKGDGVPADKAEAVNWYRKAADQGHYLAQWRLGECYANGIGVPEDKAEAVKWLCKAVRQGYEPYLDSDLIDSLGDLGSQVEEEVAKMYRRKADQGEALAQWQLGECYANGAGVPEDGAEAVKWLCKAVRQGYEPPLFFHNDLIDSLGELGNEVKEEVANLYRRKADQGEALAQWQLGECYANGKGVPEDKAEAVKWLCKAVGQGYEPPFSFDSDLIDSLGELGNEVKEEFTKMYSMKADQGDARAQWRLGKCYAEGAGIPEDKTEAANWYRKAAEQGYARAQFNLGNCYREGAGVPEDKAEAANWYRKAAEQEHARAQFELGNCYYNGAGVPEDKTEAVNWYRKAAEQWDADAQFNLAQCYDYGTGVPEDKAEAVKWYRKAAKQGHEEAAEALKRLSE